MRKTLTILGLLFVAAILFVQPAKADSMVDYTLTGTFGVITFDLPQTFTPSAPGPVFHINNVAGTLDLHSGSFPLTYGIIDLGLSDVNNLTNYWSFGSTGPELGIYAPGLFTINPDGTVTLNGGSFALSPYSATLTATVVGLPTATPEPASLVLLGFGSLALAGIRRRKAA